jgi:hypothetical protein
VRLRRGIYSGSILRTGLLRAPTVAGRGGSFATLVVIAVVLSAPLAAANAAHARGIERDSVVSCFRDRVIFDVHNGEIVFRGRTGHARPNVGSRASALAVTPRASNDSLLHKLYRSRRGGQAPTVQRRPTREAGWARGWLCGRAE